jgi:hypothetical protein
MLSSEKAQSPRNLAILAKLVENRAKVPGLRVGDYIKHPNGTYERVTAVWFGKYQTQLCGGQYHLCSSGEESYSGGLNPSREQAELKETTEIREGTIWFFDCGIAGVGRGVEFQIAERVFERMESSAGN